MQDKNLLIRSHIKAELLNYLDVHPHNIQLGISDVADLALSVGKLLSWLGAHLDADDVATRLPMGARQNSIQHLGAQYRAVALELIERRTKRKRSSSLTLEDLLERVSTLEGKAQQ